MLVTGRVFATLASLILGLGVYDTQCGAKLFRVAEEIRRIFDSPFTSRWIFDVEILARLSASRQASGRRNVSGAILEVPLPVWHEVAGSKLGLRNMLASVVDLLRIYRRYR